MYGHVRHKRHEGGRVEGLGTWLRGTGEDGCIKHLTGHPPWRIVPELYWGHQREIMGAGW